MTSGGPNASGKSNLIEVMSLLQAAPRDLAAVVRSGGGVREWVWKGAIGIDRAARLECLLSPFKGDMALRYVLGFAEAGQALEVIEERLENEKPYPGQDSAYIFFEMHEGAGVLNKVTPRDPPGPRRKLERGEIAHGQSVFSGVRDLVQYPEITHYARQFEGIRLYREWNMGREGAPRSPRPVDLPGDFLDETGQPSVGVEQHGEGREPCHSRAAPQQVL